MGSSPALLLARAPCSAIEFQVNSFTANRQQYPVGGLWSRRRLRRRLGERRRSGRRELRRLRPALLERRHAAQGAEFQVNTFTAERPARVSASADSRPAISSSSGTSRTQDGQAYGIFGRRFSSSGAAQARRVPGQHLHPELPGATHRWLTAAGGAFVVAWQSYAQDGSDSAPSPSASTSVRRRRWAPSSRSILYTTSLQKPTSLAATGRRRLRRGMDELRCISDRKRLRPPAVERGRTARQRVPGQYPHRDRTITCRRWRAAPTATSSSSGGSAQDGSAGGVFGQRFARRQSLGHRRQRRGRPPHRRAPGRCATCSVLRHHAHQRRRRRRLHALRRRRDRDPTWVGSDWCSTSTTTVHSSP